jgi:hypothetical protein
MARPAEGSLYVSHGVRALYTKADRPFDTDHNILYAFRFLTIPMHVLVFFVVINQITSSDAIVRCTSVPFRLQESLGYQDNILRAKRLFEGILKKSFFLHPSLMYEESNEIATDAIKGPGGLPFNTSYEMLVGEEHCPFVYLEGTHVMQQDLRYGFNIKITITFTNLDMSDDWYITEKNVFDSEINVYFQRVGYQYKLVKTIIVKAWSAEVGNVLQKSLNILISGQRWIACSGKRCNN